jgi:putative membrane protein
VLMALLRDTFQRPGSAEGGLWMWGWEYHIGFFSMITMVVFWTVMIIGIISLVRWLGASTHHRGREVKSEDSPLEILKMRYVKGEINKEEFEHKKERP